MRKPAITIVLFIVAAIVIGAFGVVNTANSATVAYEILNLCYQAAQRPKPDKGLALSPDICSCVAKAQGRPEMPEKARTLFLKIWRGLGTLKPGSKIESIQGVSTNEAYVWAFYILECAQK